MLTELKQIIDKWYGAIGGLTILSIYGLARSANDLVGVWGWVDIGMKWIHVRWWAETILLVAGIALLVRYVQKQAAAKYLTSESTKHFLTNESAKKFLTSESLNGFARMEFIEAINVRLGSLEERKAALDNLAMAYFLERHYPVFKKAVEKLNTTYQQACEMLQGPSDNDVGQQAYKAEDRYYQATKYLKRAVELLRREFPNERPEHLLPTGSHKYPAEVVDAYNKIWVAHETNKFRIAQLERTMNVDARLHEAHEAIDNYARSLR